jgi:transposase
MDERHTRLWAAAEARAPGYGGNAAVTKATGSGKRIWKGIRELERAERQPPVQPPQRQRVRAPGAGRKTATEADPALWPNLEGLLDPVTRGDPESALRWTTKSTRRLAEELKAQGHHVSYRTVAKLLRDHGYSLQGTRKTIEGKQHPDRDAQFQHINRRPRRSKRPGSR